jgi:hypothetical protein
VAGTPKSAPPYVLVLRQGMKTTADFDSEVARYLVKEDPAPLLTALPDPVREAVKTKNAVLDMTADALEMAWGYPESKNVSFEGELKKEVWKWPGGKRVAVLTDGRVSELP